MRIFRSSSKHALELLAGLAIVATAPAAFAASTWSDLSNNATQCATDTSGTAGNTVNCGTGTGVPSVKLTADAFSTTGAGAKFAAASVYNTGVAGAGLGVRAAGDTSDSVDNSGSTDAVRLKFTNAAGTQDANFNLTSVTLKTAAGAVADFSLLAWMGPGTPGDIAGMTTGGLFAAGWTNIGSYYGVASGAPVDVTAFNFPSTVGTGGIFSSYWLVSAFNTSFGSAPTTAGDVFTIAAIAGGLDPNAQFKPAQVPEPGSLALLGVALAGMATVRRRKNLRA